MNIGDKVRFLNDVGGGTITAFRPGGIVLVEDADGFDVPVPANEVVVIEEEVKATPAQNEAKLKAAAKENHAPKDQSESATKPASKPTAKEQVEKPFTENNSISGKELLKSKAASVEEDVNGVDENLEARITRLEMTIQALESRIMRLEAENNLRKNEKHLKSSSKPKAKSNRPATLEDLDIL